MCWPLVGLLSFLVGRIQMDHFWEKLPEKIQDAQLIWILDQQIFFFLYERFRFEVNRKKVLILTGHLPAV